MIENYFQSFIIYFTFPIAFPKSGLINLQQQLIIIINLFIPQFNSQFYFQYHI